MFGSKCYSLLVKLCLILPVTLITYTIHAAPSKKAGAKLKKQSAQTQPKSTQPKRIPSPLDGTYVENGYNPRHSTPKAIFQRYVIKAGVFSGVYSWQEGGRTHQLLLSGTAEPSRFQYYVNMGERGTADIGNQKPSLTINADVYDVVNGKKQLVASQKTLRGLVGFVYLGADGKPRFSGRAMGMNIYGIDSFGYSFFGTRASAGGTPAPIAEPEVRILFGSKDITGQSGEKVSLGQKIELTAKVSGTSALKTSSWVVSGTTIGGYSPVSSGATSFYSKPQSGRVEKTDFTRPTVKFHWTGGEDAGLVTFTGVLANGQTVQAQAAFDVEGPGGVNVKTQMDNLRISPNSYFSLGDDNDKKTTPGFKAIAEMEPNSGATGYLFWLQIVSDDVVVTGKSGKKYCNKINAALDSHYPYERSSEMVDTPGVNLEVLADPLVNVKRVFSAQSYLMWQPSGTGSVPVPVGLVKWGFSGGATRDDENATWSVVASKIDKTIIEKTTKYPEWTELVESGATTLKDCN